MFKIASIFAVMLVSVINVFPGTQNVDVKGDWEMTMVTQRGEMKRAVHFEQNDETLTVTMEGMREGEVRGNGTIAGNAVEWTVKHESPRGEFVVTYKGTVDGDSMAGTADMNGQRTIEWTAKRT